MRSYLVVLVLAVAVYWFKDPVTEYFSSPNDVDSAAESTQNIRKNLLQTFYFKLYKV